MTEFAAVGRPVRSCATAAEPLLNQARNCEFPRQTAGVHGREVNVDWHHELVNE